MKIYINLFIISSQLKNIITTRVKVVSIVKNKNWIQKFIERLAKSNEETFKGQTLDCCSLNKDSNKK